MRSALWNVAGNFATRRFSFRMIRVNHSSTSQSPPCLLTMPQKVFATSTARLAAMGSTVIVGYNSRRTMAEDVIAGLQGSGHLTLRIAIDDPASIAEAVRTVEERYGRLDALVNCGGATTPVPANDLDGLTDEIFDRTVTINTDAAGRQGRAYRTAQARHRHA